MMSHFSVAVLSNVTGISCNQCNSLIFSRKGVQFLAYTIRVTPSKLGETVRQKPPREILDAHFNLIQL